MTSIVSPDALSTHSPPMKALYAVFVALIVSSPYFAVPAA